MKTITFYSYKGGVGRTMALINITKRMVDLGKKVCILDFDLEAPGIQHKFCDYLHTTKVEKGLVDYIYQFVESGNVPVNFAEFSYSVQIGTNKTKPLDFIFAGDIYSSEYWKKLSGISWKELFYQDNSEGIPFFIDLKERIKQTFNPDYLLIDTRTGITEISAITISLFADEVVILAANNSENKFGTQQIIAAIAKNRNLVTDTIPEIHFILSRIPFNDEPHERQQEINLVKATLSELNRFLIQKNCDLQLDNILVIHSDREIEIDENAKKMAYKLNKENAQISNDYLKLFRSLTKNDFSEDELKYFEKKIWSNEFVSKALAKDDVDSEIEFLTKAIELDNENADAYFYLGVAYQDDLDYIKALEYYKQSLILAPPSYLLYLHIAHCLWKLNKHQVALNNIEKSISLNPDKIDSKLLRINILIKTGLPSDKVLELFQELLNIYPNEISLFNNRANYFNKIGEYDKALHDIHTALNMNSENSYLYSTLAEIKANQNNTDEFYLNFDRALSYGFDARGIFDNDYVDIYKHYFKEERFKEILFKYNQNEILEKVNSIDLS